MLQEGRRVLAGLRNAIQLRDPEAELRPLRAWQDAQGTSHLRYQQVYEGIPVWGSDLTVHVGSNGHVYAIGGSYVPTPTLTSTTPVLSAGEAKKRAIRDLREQGRWTEDQNITTAKDNPSFSLESLFGEQDSEEGLLSETERLVVYPGPSGRTSTLAYEVRLHPSLSSSYVYIVGAERGRILLQYSDLCRLDALSPETYADSEETSETFWGAKRSSEVLPLVASPSNVAGTFVDASGVDLSGVTRSFRSYLGSDGTYRLISDLDNFDPSAAVLPPEGADPRGGSITLDARGQDLTLENQLFEIRSSDNTWTDPVAVSAHYNASVAYDYYRSVHGRAGIDGQNGTIYSIVHVTRNGESMQNAFYSSAGVMAYGDGGSTLKPLANGLDVAAHEMTHGVIDNSANLKYLFESGALNESFADIFGVLVEREDALVGEDVVRAGQGIAMRDLSDPDNPNVLSPQPDHYSDFVILPDSVDNGGVHINSGIPNRAAFLVIQSIGLGKAEQIYYRALTTYLNRRSDFVDARLALVQSAKDLYGNAEVDAVRQAFDTVGIGSNSGSDEDPSADDVPPIVGGQSNIAYVDPNGTVHTYNPETNETFRYPEATVRGSAGTFGRVTTTTAGERVWFVDPDGFLSYVELSSGKVFFYPDLNLGQEGDLWNAAISPDGSVVALVSAYQNDANIYFWTGDDVVYVRVAPPTTQEGITSETIARLDVVSWSPNLERPKVAADALNRISLTAGTLSLWEIHEIDFAEADISNLFPGQPNYISLGNVTYSSTDPDVVAFNAVNNDTGVWDILLRDETNGNVAALGISSLTLNGTSITDAQRPAFAPDDSLLAFSSPANRALLFLNGQSLQVSALEFSEAPRNPFWFRREGRRLPVELARFTSTVDDRRVRLSWTTASETNNAGFHVERLSPDATGWVEEGFLPGAGTTERPQEYTYAISDLAFGTHRFRLRQVDTDGTASLSDEITAKIRPQEALRVDIYPTPSLSPRVHLAVQQPQVVDVEVYDILGRRVARLFRGRIHVQRTFDLQGQAALLPSGSYFVRATGETQTATGRFTIVR